jgi:hypothetical protein
LEAARTLTFCHIYSYVHSSFFLNFEAFTILKMRFLLQWTLLVASFQAGESLSVVDSDDDVNVLINTIADLDSGILITDATLIGTDCAGTFTGGADVGAADFPETGIVLSTGRFNSAEPDGNNNGRVNDSASRTEERGEAGDDDLEATAGDGIATEDACGVSFQFTCSETEQIGFSFDYVFGSEEYTEFVDGGFNDNFAFYLNGVNIALIPGTTTFVSIDTVNADTNSGFFLNNDVFDDADVIAGFTPEDPPFATEMDGFTTTLTSSGLSNVGTNTMKIVVADVGDQKLDSWVLIKSTSLACGDAAPTVSPAPTTSQAPSKAATDSPTLTPTVTATMAPTLSPTTGTPTVSPTMEPTLSPTTLAPTTSPTMLTTLSPTLSSAPTVSPTMEPTLSPTLSSAPSISSEPTNTPTEPLPEEDECFSSGKKGKKGNSGKKGKKGNGAGGKGGKGKKGGSSKGKKSGKHGKGGKGGRELHDDGCAAGKKGKKGSSDSGSSDSGSSDSGSSNSKGGKKGGKGGKGGKKSSGKKSGKKSRVLKTSRRSKRRNSVPRVPLSDRE